MKKILLTISSVITVITSHASMSVVWSTNLNDIAALDWNHASIKEFYDGSVAVLSWQGPNQLLVFNSDGELIYDDLLEGNTLGYGGLFSGDSKSPDRFFVINSFSSNSVSYKNLRIYDKVDESYSMSKIIGTNQTFSLKGDDGATQNSGKYLYIIDDSILTKYQFSTSTVYLSDIISMGISNSNYVISWNSEPDFSYQIQSSSNLTNWTNVGSPITGTGAPITWSSSLGQSNNFFRIISE